MKHISPVLFAIMVLAAACAVEANPEKEWVSLFNGRDLDGWIVKTKGYPAGENPWNLFRVEDGKISEYLVTLQVIFVLEEPGTKAA